MAPPPPPAQHSPPPPSPCRGGGPWLPGCAAPAVRARRTQYAQGGTRAGAPCLYIYIYIYIYDIMCGDGRRKRTWRCGSSSGPSGLGHRAAPSPTLSGPWQSLSLSLFLSLSLSISLIYISICNVHTLNPSPSHRFTLRPHTPSEALRIAPARARGGGQGWLTRIRLADSDKVG